jgi:predicted DsbA family dithiol-disulfide isomerase
MQKVVSTYESGKVAWVYRHSPIDALHQKSRKEAEATECVNELGGNSAFWTMLDAIYANTPSNDGLEASKLPQLAKNAGVDVEQFTSCLTSGKYASKIESSIQDAAKAGANGTPYSLLILKEKLTDQRKKNIESFVSVNELTYNGEAYIKVLDDNTVSMNGAMPVQVITALLDIILK